MAESTNWSRMRTSLLPTSKGDDISCRADLPICKIYIDDVIVYADKQTNLSSLEQVITCSRKYGLTYNPDKVKLGLSQIEYEGLEIDSTVIIFSLRS